MFFPLLNYLQQQGSQQTLIIIYKEFVDNQADEIKDFHLIKNLAIANYHRLIFVPWNFGVSNGTTI